MAKVKDTDFLHISPRIKVMEMKLLSSEDIQRMINAPTDEDAAKVAIDKGFKSFDSADIKSLEKSLESSIEELYNFLAPHMPNEHFLNFFKIKNDYNNIKAILKGDALGVGIDSMLSQNGVFSKESIKDIVRDEDFSQIDQIMKDGITESREILLRTSDPQLLDIRLDMAMYEHMTKLANMSKSEFLIGYMRLMTDGDNLRAFVRVKRMKKTKAFMEKVIASGGNIPKKDFLQDDESLEKIYSKSPFAYGARLGESIIRGESPFAPLDLFVDNTLMEYAKSAKYVSFGDKTVLGYIVAREREVNQLRTVMVGRMAKRPKEKIVESLRINYV